MSKKSIFENVTIDHCGTGVSLPASGVDAEFKSLSISNTDRAIHFRDPSADAIGAVLSKLPPGTDPQQVIELFKAINAAGPTPEGKAAAAQKTPIWDAFTDKGPELMAFLFKAAVAWITGSNP
ncbi:hypothetical protein [Burkholderia gladioli]|uniref:hypothetical protein n=1 Tax=Burkholderia gladioli TaxID=28095 RepID=UPI0016412E6C|nr:hypothetical protein [Burkholderia gladioli]